MPQTNFSFCIYIMPERNSGSEILFFPHLENYDSYIIVQLIINMVWVFEPNKKCQITMFMAVNVT